MKNKITALTLSVSMLLTGFVFPVSAENTLPEIEFTFEDKTVTYNSQVQSLTASDVPDGAKVEYDIDTEYKNAGEYEISATVTLEGYKTTTKEATLSIDKYPLLVEDAKTISRDYNGTNIIEIIDAKISGIIEGDELFVENIIGFTDDKNADTAKTVKLEGVFLGNDAENYTLSQIDDLKVDILPLNVSAYINSVDTKVFDNTTEAMANFELSYVILGDTVYVTSVATFDDENAGEDKNVTITDLALSGEDSSNYLLILEDFETTGTILKADLDISVENQFINSYTNTLDTIILPTVLGVDFEEISGEFEWYTNDLRTDLAPFEFLENTTLYWTFTPVSQNYNLAHGETDFVLTDKNIPTIEVLDITTTYTGEILSNELIEGLATFNDEEVSGVFGFVNEHKNVLDSGLVEVYFVANDTDLFETISTFINLTINKATPTGTPSYTKITTSNKTLADAYLNQGDISIIGEISWDLPLDTKVESGVYYNYIFIPQDTDNFENLTGSIMLRTANTSGSTGGGSLGGNSGDDSFDDGFDDTTEDENLFDKFTDISENDWYYEYVKFVVEQGLFVGVSETEFAPLNNMTRAMIWTVLYRYMDGTGITTGENWYDDALNWALEYEITDGTNPQGNVTREQLATFLYRIVEKPSVENHHAQSFDDANDISLWAFDAMCWAVEQGIFEGRLNNNLAPTDFATRAEVSTILMRFINL